MRDGTVITSAAPDGAAASVSVVPLAWWWSEYVVMAVGLHRIKRLSELRAEREAREVAAGLSPIGRERFEAYLTQERARVVRGGPAAAWRALERALDDGCRECDPGAVVLALHRGRRRGD